MSWTSRSGVNSGPGYFFHCCDEENENLSEKDKVLYTCETHYQFIASQAEHLEKLRGQCSTSAQLTQQEIRGLEEKLVKLFSAQLILKWKLPKSVALSPELNQYPSLTQWLQVVGLSKESVKIVCDQVNDLEDLLEKTERDLRLILSNRSDPNEIFKLVKAVQNLKRCTENVLHGRSETWNSSSCSSLPLYWDSWHQPCPPSPRFISSKIEPRLSVSSSDGDSGSGHKDGSVVTSGGCYSDDSATISSSPSTPAGVCLPQSSPCSPFSPPFCSASTNPSHGGGGFLNSTYTVSPHHLQSHHHEKYTPPPTPPTFVKILNVKPPQGDKKFPTTPPPVKKYLLNMIQPYIGRSTSHDSQLYSHIDNSDSPVPGMEYLPRHRARLHSELGTDVTSSESGLPSLFKRMEYGSNKGDICDDRRNSPVSPNMCSSTVLPYPTYEYNDEDISGKNQLAPRSPRTPTIPGSMVHNVQHRFAKYIKSATCGYCHQKFSILNGLKCKECNFKCHRECEPNVPPSCGLPHEYLDYFAESLRILGRSPHGLSPSHKYNERIDSKPFSHSHPHINCTPFHDPGSSSNTSSCNSSTPSSPALFQPNSPANKRAFNYPDIKRREPDIPVDMRPLSSYIPKPSTAPNSVVSSQNEVIDSQQSLDSDRTVSVTSGSGSTGTDDSDRTLAGRVDSQDSTVSDGETGTDAYCTRQNSVSSVSQSLREWDIPYDELNKCEIIGKGRFGAVYSGNWHGQVAIRELHMDCNDEKALEAFKMEVSSFRKTRHENLVLFMGACMNPPRLAIVTSLCQGMTLYKHIHVLKEKFNMTKTIPVAVQISQGMGYLHARGIIHKDLKSKNIFLENGKVVITDFGLLNITRLCNNDRKGYWLHVPAGWLCYLAPEIMRCLTAKHRQDDLLPFSSASDVYAFGTVWFELLCGEWPHKSLSSEAVIWQVGKGMKPSLAHLQASKEVKDILMACWSYGTEERPEFSFLRNLLTRLPKKKLARSPSHPVHLSRSAESVF